MKKSKTTFLLLILGTLTSPFSFCIKGQDVQPDSGQARVSIVSSNGARQNFFLYDSLVYAQTNAASNTVILLNAGYHDLNMVSPPSSSNYRANVRWKGMGQDATHIRFGNPGSVGNGVSQTYGVCGSCYQDVFFDLVGLGSAVTYLGVDYSFPLNTTCTNNFKNDLFYGGNDIWVYGNSDATRPNGTSKAVSFLVEGCSLYSGWDIFATFNDTNSGIFDNLGGIPASSLTFRDCYINIHTNRASSNTAASAHLLNVMVLPSLYIENCRMRFEGGIATVLEPTGDVSLCRIYTLTNASTGIIANSTLQIKDTIIEAWGTNLMSPIQLIDAYKAVSTNVFISGLTWCSNGFQYGYDTVFDKLTFPGWDVTTTNLIDGKTYSNSYGGTIEVSANVVLTEAGVVGFSGIGLEVSGVRTNRSTQPTAIGGVAGAVTNYLSIVVPPTKSWVFTNNISTGTGNSSTISGGQIKFLLTQP